MGKRDLDVRKEDGGACDDGDDVICHIQQCILDWHTETHRILRTNRPIHTC